MCGGGGANGYGGVYVVTLSNVVVRAIVKVEVEGGDVGEVEAVN